MNSKINNQNDIYYKAYEERYAQVYEKNMMWSSSKYTPDVINFINSNNATKEHKILDLGCGEGYYTSKMSVYCTKTIGVDLSKDALKIAARDDKKSQYVLASIFHLPIDKVDFITNIFAPTPFDEIKRILKKW